MSDSKDQRSEEQILRDRAARLARKLHSDRDRKLVMRIAVIGAGSERFGIEVEMLREIVAAPDITPLPGLPGWMPGIVQIRGELITVVDLAGLFGIETKGSKDNLAVIENNQGALGLLAESVEGFTDVYEDEMARNLGEVSANNKERPLLAATKDLISILDLKKFMADQKLIVDQSS